MDTNADIFSYVMSRLRAKEVTQRDVADGSGVPFSTVCKIAQGKICHPSVHTIQAIYNFFRSHEGSGGCASIERATNGAVRCEDLRPDVDWANVRGTNKEAA